VDFPHDPVALREYIQQLADRGLKVELTEVDARLRLFEDAEDPYEAQGRHVRAEHGVAGSGGGASVRWLRWIGLVLVALASRAWTPPPSAGT